MKKFILILCTFFMPTQSYPIAFQSPIDLYARLSGVVTNLSPYNGLTAVCNWFVTVPKDFTLYRTFKFITKWVSIVISIRQAYSYIMVEKSPIKERCSKVTFKDYANVPQEIKDLVQGVKGGNLSKNRTGIMFYGPPGTGKTHLGDCIAGELECPLFRAPITQIINNKEDGGGQAQLRGLFLAAHEAAGRHESGVAVILLNEFDAIGKREKADDTVTQDASNFKQIGVMTQLLDLLDEKPDNEVLKETFRQAGYQGATHGLFSESSLRASKANALSLFKVLSNKLSFIPYFSKKPQGRVIVIGTTNHIDNIDEAMTREGRFNIKIKLDLPDENQREDFVKHFFTQHTIPLNEVDGTIDEISKKISKLTEGFSCVELDRLLFQVFLPCTSSGRMFWERCVDHLMCKQNQNEAPSCMYSNRQIANQYMQKDAQFGQITWERSAVLDGTQNMSKDHIKKIFEGAKLYAKEKKSPFVDMECFNKSKENVLIRFQQEKEDNIKKMLNIYTTLCPYTSNIISDTIFSKINGVYNSDSFMKNNFFANPYFYITNMFTGTCKNNKSGLVTADELVKEFSAAFAGSSSL